MLSILTTDRCEIMDVLARGPHMLQDLIRVLGGNGDVHSADYQRTLRHLKVLRDNKYVLYDGLAYAVNRDTVGKVIERLGAWKGGR